MVTFNHSDLPSERQGEFDPMTWGEPGARLSPEDLDLIDFGGDLDNRIKAGADLEAVLGMDEAYLGALDLHDAESVVPVVEGFEDLRHKEVLRIAADIRTRRQQQ